MSNIRLPDKDWEDLSGYVAIGDYKVAKSCLDRKELKLDWIVRCIETIVEYVNSKE